MYVGAWRAAAARSARVVEKAAATGAMIPKGMCIDMCVNMCHVCEHVYRHGYGMCVGMGMGMRNDFVSIY